MTATTCPGCGTTLPTHPPTDPAADCPGCRTDDSPRPWRPVESLLWLTAALAGLLAAVH